MSASSLGVPGDDGKPEKNNKGRGRLKTMRKSFRLPRGGNPFTDADFKAKEKASRSSNDLTELQRNSGGGEDTSAPPAILSSVAEKEVSADQAKASDPSSGSAKKLLKSSSKADLTEGSGKSLSRSASQDQAGTTPSEARRSAAAPSKPVPAKRNRVYKEDKILWPVLGNVLDGMQLSRDSKAQLTKLLRGSLNGPARLHNTKQCIGVLEASVFQARSIYTFTEKIVKVQAAAKRWLGVRRYRRLHHDFGGDTEQMLDRLAAVREITASEQSYAHRLGVMYSKIYPALHDEARKKLIPVRAQELATVFDHLGPIVEAHQNISKALNGLQWPELTAIGASCMQIVAEFRKYESFMRHFKLGQGILNTLCENEKFKAKLAEFSKPYGIDARLTLGTPISRVAFFASQFKQILAATPTTNKEYPEIFQASREMGILHEVLKQAVKRYAAKSDQHLLAERFVLPDDVDGADVATKYVRRMLLSGDYHSAEHCRLLFESQVTELETVKDKERSTRVYIFILSNALIVTKQGKQQFAVRSVIDFDAEASITLKKEQLSKGKDTQYLALVSAQHWGEQVWGDQHGHAYSHKFSFKDESERDTWYLQLNGALEYHRKRDVYGKSIDDLVDGEKATDGIPKLLTLVSAWLHSDSNLYSSAQLFAENITTAEKPYWRRFFRDISTAKYQLEEFNSDTKNNGKAEDDDEEWKEVAERGKEARSHNDTDVIVNGFFMTFRRLGAENVTAALKLFLHGLTEPLFGFGNAVKFASLSIEHDFVRVANELRSVLTERGEDNPGQKTVHFCLNVLADVGERSLVDVKRLALYLSPVLVRQEVSTIEFSRRVPAINDVLCLLIQNLDLLLGKDEIEQKNLVMPEDDADDSSGVQVTFRMASHKFAGTKPIHLSLSRGQVIRVTQQGTAWPRGVNKFGQFGKFPENFTVPCSVLVVARHAYKPTDAGRLAMDKGDILEVHDQNTDGWWKGTNLRTDSSGFFPANFCRFELRRRDECVAELQKAKPVKREAPAKTVGEPVKNEEPVKKEDPAGDSKNKAPSSADYAKSLLGAVSTSTPAKENDGKAESDEKSGSTTADAPPVRAPPQAPTKPVTQIPTKPAASRITTEAPKQKEDADKGDDGVSPRPKEPSKRKKILLKPDGKPYMLRAKFQFEARSGKEISFAKNDRIRLIFAKNLEKGGWWTGVNETKGDDKPGRFPSNYCEMLDE